MPKFRVGYENAVASRADLTRIYEAILASGGFPNPEEDAILFEEAYKERKGKKEPRSGWESIAKELRLIELGCGPLVTKSMSHAQILKDVRKAQALLVQANAVLKGLEYQLPYLSAINSRPDRLAVMQREKGIGEMVRDLANARAFLERFKPPAKWNARSKRQMRVRLAVLLSPLFESEFGEKAKPVGGSARVEDADSNDWTRFYQMAASIFWGEHSTPDRQAVLWEATLPPMKLP